MATCAACRKPIRNGQKIALSGPEVFHRECAMGGTTESIGNKLRARALELQAELDRKTSDLERVRAELDNLRRINTDAHKDNARLQRDVDAARIQLSKMRDAYELANDDANRIIVQRDNARRERDAALSHVALLETLARSVPVAPVVVTPDVTEREDTRDASEVRFSLIELDKP